jgi:phosphomannomutase
MSLIKSISGFRGTIGGKTGDNLTPIDIVKFAAAYGNFVLNELKTNEIKQDKPKVVVGRDARISGEMVQQLVMHTLTAMGINIIDVGLSTTPTVEVMVPKLNANGGIILTASHNPKQWNALKLLNSKGEFINDKQGKTLLNIAEKEDFDFAEVQNLGKITTYENAIEDHIDMILKLPYVNIEAIKNYKFKVVIDCVNSTGGIALPKLLKKLGVDDIVELYCTPDGHFPHNPEPLPEHLTELSRTVKKEKAHVGFSVDPDVDRLAMVCENGEMFGEEYTLVAVADYVLKSNPGATVSNLSSSRALRDITEAKKMKYTAAAVGEVNVVEVMKETNAVIGGEGNGGVILPELHYGRDALVGIALFLSHVATIKKPVSLIRAMYPSYGMAKNKIELSPNVDLTVIFEKLRNKYLAYPQNTVDGLKIEFDTDWVHLRKSNTEPIIRIYSESGTVAQANVLAEKIMTDIKTFI